LSIARIETPSAAERRWFGAIVLAFFGLVGGVVTWRFGLSTASYVLWGVGAGLALLYYAVRPLQVPLYKGWMHLFAPIGWAVSHGILAIIYFGILTPIALCMRLFGRDKLERRFVAAQATYWSEHPPELDPARYLRQS
jgi:hypothetical protein